MAKRSSLRASDADRDHVAERLRVAAAEGRIFAHELEERLARALRASTYGELDAVVEDLPGAPVAVAPRRPVPVMLLRRHPVPLALFAAVTGVVVAALITAVLAVAASGVWLIPALVFLVLRGRGVRSGRRRGRRLGVLHMSAPGRRHPR